VVTIKTAGRWYLWRTGRRKGLNFLSRLNDTGKQGILIIGATNQYGRNNTPSYSHLPESHAHLMHNNIRLLDKFIRNFIETVVN